MARIRWTQGAAEWLEEIFQFIAADSTEAALSVVNAIYEKAQTLVDFPAVGHIYRTEPEGEIRILLHGHYRIAYLHRVGDDMVEILGVFHGALDISRYLQT